MKLSQFISMLEAMPKDAQVQFARFAPPDPESIGWSVPDGAVPGSFMSYRGYYDRLGLDWSDRPKTVAELVAQARECIGKTFTGYKGGEYVMDERTPVHIAEYGSSGDDVPVAVELRAGVATILVAAVETW